MNFEDFLQPQRSSAAGTSSVLPISTALPGTTAHGVHSSQQDPSCGAHPSMDVRVGCAQTRSFTEGSSDGTLHSDVPESQRLRKRPRGGESDDVDAGATEDEYISPMSYGSSPTFNHSGGPSEPRTEAAKKARDCQVDNDPEIIELQRKVRKAELELKLRSLKDKLTPTLVAAPPHGGFRSNMFGYNHGYGVGYYSEAGDSQMDIDPLSDDVGMIDSNIYMQRAGYQRGGRMEAFNAPRNPLSRFQNQLAITNDNGAPRIRSSSYTVEPMDVELPNVIVQEVHPHIEPPRIQPNDLDIATSTRDQEVQIEETTLIPSSPNPNEATQMPVSNPTPDEAELPQLSSQVQVNRVDQIEAEPLLSLPHVAEQMKATSSTIDVVPTRGVVEEDAETKGGSTTEMECDGLGSDQNTSNEDIALVTDDIAHCQLPSTSVGVVVAEGNPELTKTDMLETELGRIEGVEPEVDIVDDVAEVDANLKKGVDDEANVDGKFEQGIDDGNNMKELLVGEGTGITTSIANELETPPRGQDETTDQTVDKIGPLNSTELNRDVEPAEIMKDSQPVTTRSSLRLCLRSEKGADKSAVLSKDDNPEAQDGRGRPQPLRNAANQALKSASNSEPSTAKIKDKEKVQKTLWGGKGKVRMMKDL